jgi:hypothetical protein
MDSRLAKSIAVKGLRLQECLNDYQGEVNNKEQALKKFVAVWGPHTASHLLMEYNDAKSLIWAFDDVNLELFIEKF